MQSALPCLAKPPYLLLDNSEQVTCRQQQVFFAVVLQFGATVLGENNGVAFVNTHWGQLALVIRAARANCDDGCFLWLFLSRIWNNQTGCGGGLSCYDLDEYLVLQWLDVCHGYASSMCMHQVAFVPVASLVQHSRRRG